MASQRGLTVRGSERQRIELPVQFVIADEHRAQVRFSTNSAALDEFAVSGVSFDLSVGGLGFSAVQFLPRHCEGTIRVMSHAGGTPGSKNIGAGDGKPACVRIEHRVKIRRVWMDTKNSMYSIGLAFVDPSPSLESEVRTLVSEVEQRMMDASAGGNGANNDA